MGAIKFKQAKDQKDTIKAFKDINKILKVLLNIEQYPKL